MGIDYLSLVKGIIQECCLEDRKLLTLAARSGRYSLNPTLPRFLRVPDAHMFSTRFAVKWPVLCASLFKICIEQFKLPPKPKSLYVIHEAQTPVGN